MLTIQRAKDGKTYFATRVLPEGLVAGWSPDPAQAVPVDPTLAGRVKAHYAARPAAGALTFLPVGGYRPDAPMVPQDAVDKLAAELSKAKGEWVTIRDEHRVLAEEHAAVVAERDALRHKVAALEADLAARPPAPVVTPPAPPADPKAKK